MKRISQEQGIRRSEMVIVDRLLARNIELREAYDDLQERLRSRPREIGIFMDMLLGVAVYWNPDKIAKVRAGQSRVKEINSRISCLAEEIADLLDQRDDLEEEIGISSDTYQDPLEVVIAAADENPSFQSYVKDDLNALIRRFDAKYWPSLSDFMREISNNTCDPETTARDPVTRAAMTGVRSSMSDFFKALFAAIRQHTSVGSQEVLPHDFVLSDNTFASLANCALDLGPDEMVDGAYVKRLRQRERTRKCDT